MAEAGEIVLTVGGFQEQCAPETIQTLRELDQGIAELRLKMQEAVKAYVAAKGWDMDVCNVNVNIETGVVTVSAR